jgi:aspartate/methionine/tyrosine aminotransferase
MQFSSRILGSTSVTPWASAVERARARGAIRCDLTVTNPTAVGLGVSDPSALAALSDPRSLAYEPSPQGLFEAREAVCEHYLREHNATVSPKQVWLAASTSELYAQLFMLHCDPGDEVLVPRPSYPLFDALASLTGARATRFSLRYDGAWMLDTDSIERAFSPRTRALVLVSPNNPTGSRLREAELAWVADACARRGVALLVDEVFAEFLLDPAEDAVATTAREPRCLCWTLGGLSKSAALPQMKLGWAALSGPESLVREAEARFEHVTDAFLSASAPVQHAARSLLAHGAAARAEILARARANLAFARAATPTSCGVTVLGCEGGWSAVLRVPNVRDEDEWLRALLEEDRVLVQPGYFYDFEREGFLVVSLLQREELFREGLSAIAARAERWLRE